MVKNIWSILLALLVQTQSASAEAQTAEVTFYSNASIAKKLLPIASDTAFYGYIYDGPEKLLVIKHGQFATFALPLGSHDFSASLHKHPAKNSVVPVLLLAGMHYFLSASMDIGASSHKGVVEQVDCKTAHEHAQNTHAVPAEQIDDGKKSEVVAETSFPACGL